jgi:Orn/Lys/Arg decarboxylase, N-terminal domain.
MKKLKIAIGKACPQAFITSREFTPLDTTTFVDVAAIVLNYTELNDAVLNRIQLTGFSLPIFVTVAPEHKINEKYLTSITAIFSEKPEDAEYQGRQLETAALKYERQILPPFSTRWSITLSKGIAPSIAPGIRVGNSSVVILRETNLSTILVKRFFAQTYVTPMWRWAICSFMKVLPVPPSSMLQKYSTPTKLISF